MKEKLSRMSNSEEMVRKGAFILITILHTQKDKMYAFLYSAAT